MLIAESDMLGAAVMDRVFRHLISALYALTSRCRRGLKCGLQIGPSNSDDVCCSTR